MNITIISDLIDKLEDIACNRMRSTDDALTICDAIDILQVLDSAGIIASHTPQGTILEALPIFLRCGWPWKWQESV